MSEISEKVYELADKIAVEAMGSDDSAFRLDAFKALTQFFIGTTRLSGKMRDDDESVGMSMTHMRALVNGAEQPKESTLVASARRRAAGEVRVRDRNGKFL